MENISDGQMLRQYYETVYGSSAYKDYISAENIYNQTSKKMQGRRRASVTYPLMLIAFIYGAIFVSFRFGFWWSFAAVALPLILIIRNGRTAGKADSDVKRAFERYSETRSVFDQLAGSTPKPPLPGDMLNPSCIRALLAVFDADRAQTFEQALEVYKQDQILIAQENARRQAEYQAQQEMERQAAENARREADWARSEADYHQAQADYYRSSGDSNSADWHQGQSDYWNTQW